MDVPYIKPIEKFSQLMDLVGSDSEFGKRLQLLEDFEKRVNKMLQRYSDIADAQGYLSAARVELEAAERTKADADIYAKNKMEDADKILNDIGKKGLEFDEHMKRENAALSDKLREASDKAVEQALKDRELSQKQNDVFKLKAEAEALMASAQELKKEYETKLEKIRAAAA